MLKSKIHRARVTDANLDYEGSITIDRELIAAADILPFEQVEVLNINNGARIATYAIAGKKGEICLNGAAARSGAIGDIVLILSYAHVDDKAARNITPKIVYVDEKNALTAVREGPRQ
jgi:aspartate 1-decarboxylase